MGVLHVDKLQASERPLADALNAMGHGKLMALLYFPIRFHLDFIKLRSTISSEKKVSSLPLKTKTKEVQFTHY